jgi:hypothetical protein
MPIDLYAANPAGEKPRPDERFHIREGPPIIKSHFDWWILRRTCWKVKDDTFVSWFFFGHLQIYHGIKIDGSRTYMGWNGQLGDKLDHNMYVMTTTPKEQFAFRWRTKRPGAPIWSDQAGT